MTSQPAPTGDPVAAVRRFNRFYTRRIGLLEERLHRSAYSLTEVRVLYELARRDGATAAELGRDLGLDAGYLSRMVKRFAAAGLVARRPSPDDGRRALLALTEAGQAAFRPLDAAAEAEVSAMLKRLAPRDRRRLVAAMAQIERLLGAAGGGDAAPPAVRLRPPRSGDIGRIVERQGRLYAEEYGWDIGFEALVAEILAGFVRDHDPARERGWVAERDGEVVGSVFLVRESDAVAKLRLLYVEPAARGCGLGRRLVGECVGFARARGYARITLWTNDVLVAAGRIYREAGFRLVAAAPHRSFGRELVGQTWELEL